MAFRAMPENKNSPFTIAIRLPNWVGDVCMSLPCVQWLADSGHDLVVYGRPWAQSLVTHYKPRAFVSLSGQFSNDLAAAKQAQTQINGLTRGLILPDSLSSAAIFRFAGIASLGYRHDGRSLLLKWPVNKPIEMHAAHKWWRLIGQAAKKWQLPTPPDVPPITSLLPSQKEEQTVVDLMRAENLSTGKYILVAPTATGLHKGKVKVWPHFGALVQALQAAGHRVVACPPANEQKQVKTCTPSVHTIGPLSLGGFAVLAKHASVVICNDSGVSHLAATVSARQITLFGVTDPNTTGPVSSNATVLGSLNQWPSFDAVLKTTIDQVCTPAVIAHE